MKVYFAQPNQIRYGAGGCRYKLQTVEIEMVLRPFIPDYVPVVGETDPFLKVSPARPGRINSGGGGEALSNATGKHILDTSASNT